MRTVLIIEDDAILSEMYKDKYQLSNFGVLIATDGAMGLTLALHNKPDIILLDLALPKMHGIDIMAKLREDSWGKQVPIIVLTNLNVDGKVLEGIMKHKPVYCLLKSNITPEEVVEKANEILKNQKN